MAHPSMGSRTASAPVITGLQTSNQLSGTSSRPRPPAVNAGSTPLNPPYAGPWPGQGQSSLKESPMISGLPAVHHQQPQQSLPGPNLNPPAMTYASVAKSSPDRYRRNHRRAETGGASNTTGSTVPQAGLAMPSGSGMASVGHLYHHPTQTSSTPALTSYSSYNSPGLPSPPNGKQEDPMGQQRLSNKDDISVQRQSTSDLAKRYRRRSISSIEARDHGVESQNIHPAQPKTYAAMLAGPAPDRKENRPLPPSAVERPISSHGRQTSNESNNSGRSSSRPRSVCVACFNLP